MSQDLSFHIGYNGLAIAFVIIRSNQSQEKAAATAYIKLFGEEADIKGLRFSFEKSHPLTMQGVVQTVYSAAAEFVNREYRNYVQEIMGSYPHTLIEPVDFMSNEATNDDLLYLCATQRDLAKFILDNENTVGTMGDLFKLTEKIQQEKLI